MGSDVRKRGGSPAAGDPVTKADMLGTERRWRRFGEPVPAGATVREDGSPDFGIFGPGSVVWEVLLHPSTILFHHAAQQKSQDVYKPIKAGIRDHEPVSRKAREGTFTIFDAFERLQRGAAMHLPMWLGDSTTAQSMAKHLHNIHKRVKGDVIDTGEPELGGYAASEPREAMWAALTEMHPMLRVYEAFAFRGGHLPHRLPAAQRDQFMHETAAYCRLHGAPEEEIPTSMAQLAALYEKYDHLFGRTETIALSPVDGRNYEELFVESSKKNWQRSHLRPMLVFVLVDQILGTAVIGALPRKTQEGLGLGAKQRRRVRRARWLVLPLAWILQRGPIERYFTRLLWGSDGVVLIQSARRLHREALAARRA